MKDSVEILAIVTKAYPNNKKEDLKSLTNGYDRNKYFDFLKVLNENTVYSLNNTFDIKYKPNETITITKLGEPLELYSQNKINIQVNAIVGMNGSGKSTLSELLYLMLYNLAVSKGLIKDEKGNKILDFKGFLNAFLVVKHKRDIIIVDFEILDYYIHEGDQKKGSNSVQFYSALIVNEEKSIFEFSVLSEVKFDIKELFYMISLNYSMYGLNELKMGKWIKHIFHKNDMYDTPIVINPYRELGKINVNTEDAQNNARVLSNLIKRDNTDWTTITHEYKLDELFIYYDLENSKSAYLTDSLKKYVKNKLLINDNAPYVGDYKPIDFFSIEKKEKGPLDPVILELKERISLNVDLLNVQDYATLLLQNSPKAFKVIHKVFFNLQNSDDLIEISNNISISNNGSKIIDDLFSYFICKLYRIGYIYEKEFGGLLNKKKNGFDESDKFEKELVSSLISDSHACFKLKRVYYFLNFSKGKDIFQFVGYDKMNTRIIWKLRDFSDRTPDSLIKNLSVENNLSNYNLIKKHFSEVNDLIWKVPPPIFKTTCLLNNTIERKGKVNLNQLSSGETQFIYALQTILYHIINIDSNNDYKNIVLLLDEIELYYHPEYQRVFLSTLLTQIKELKLDNIINIQILFLTHSPFILSDIPSSNILKLKNGTPELEENQTFGANIHDLLANDFFLKDGFMGEFAKKHITDLIEDVNELEENISKDVFSDFLNKIEVIGEPFIKYKMIETLESKYLGSSNELDEIIKKKEKELNRLKIKRANDKN